MTSPKGKAPGSADSGAGQCGEDAAADPYPDSVGPADEALADPYPDSDIAGSVVRTMMVGAAAAKGPGIDEIARLEILRRIASNCANIPDTTFEVARDIADLGHAVDFLQSYEGEKEDRRKAIVRIGLILRRHLAWPTAREVLRLSALKADAVWKFEMKRRSKYERLGDERYDEFKKELRDEQIHRAIMERRYAKRISIAAARREIAREGRFGIGEGALKKAVKRHSKRANARGIAYPSEQILSGILPPSRLGLRDFPGTPGRPRKR